MTRKKKTGRGAHKVRSRGVWIAPDLERKIKGEGGRRGLTEPPYSYYLHLADLVLKPAAAAAGSSAGNRERQGAAPEPPFEPRSLESFAPSPTQARDSAQSMPAPLMDLIPAPLPPVAPALPLPKLNRPKPPKQRTMPRPPKLSPSKPPLQKQRGKLSLPKPPKREK